MNIASYHYNAILGLTWADAVILAIMFLSIVIGLWRGFVREALSLVTWGASLLLAFIYCTHVAHYCFQRIDTPALRILAGFVLIFFVGLIAGTLCSKLIAGIIQRGGLSGIDRMIGLIFGVLRGVLIVALLITVVKLMHLNQEPGWQHSVLVPQFVAMVEWLQHLLPKLIATI